MCEFFEWCGEGGLFVWFDVYVVMFSVMVDCIMLCLIVDVCECVFVVIGVDDVCLVMGELFIQWVIEDCFVVGWLCWELVGVEFVDDVYLYEEVKICIFNVMYSCIVWVGMFVGYIYIYEGMYDLVICCFVYDYVMQDVILCFMLSLFDFVCYCDVVLECFGNLYVFDMNQCVVVDGFLKILGFIVLMFVELFVCGVVFIVIVVLFVLFLCFFECWVCGMLLYVYQDGVMDDSSVCVIVGVVDFVVVFGVNCVLWGLFVGNVVLFDVLCVGFVCVDVWFVVC